MPDSIEIPKSRSSGLSHLRRKTMVSVLRAWREVQGTARNAIGAEIRPDVPKEDLDHLVAQMQDCLAPKGGELTARAHTAELGQTYLHLSALGRGRFLRLLAAKFDTDSARVDKAIVAYQKASGAAEKLKAESELRQALMSPRTTILRQFTDLPNGFKFLVDMRADLLALASREIAMKGLEYDLKSILSSWFDIGLLDLEEITWNSPASLLEKLIEYEAVHRINSWDDLKNRLDADRRVYAFFHNKMPLEPLIFVQVAFVHGLADNVQALLDTTSPLLDLDKADTAIFYSISNAQKGLAGISFGNFLIKRVVAELSRQFKQIKTYATLSPVPGFRAWLDPLLVKGGAVLQEEEGKKILALHKEKNAGAALLALLSSDWHKQSKTVETLKPILMRLCAHYLLNEKKNDKPLDPVANFHLFNGARLERINWLGDTSSKGFKQSAGIMVNYYYKLSDIDGNHEEFAAGGKVVASRQVKSYL